MKLTANADHHDLIKLLLSNGSKNHMEREEFIKYYVKKCYEALVQKQEKLLRIKTVIITEEEYLFSEIAYFDIIDLKVHINDINLLDKELKIIYLTDDEHDIMNHIIKTENIDIVELISTELPDYGKLIIKKLCKVNADTPPESPH